MHLDVVNMEGFVSETPYQEPLYYYVDNLGVESYGAAPLENSDVYVCSEVVAERFPEDEGESRSVYTTTDDFPMYFHMMKMTGFLKTTDKEPLCDDNNLGVDSYEDTPFEDSEIDVCSEEVAEGVTEDEEGVRSVHTSTEDFPMYLHVMNMANNVETPDKDCSEEAVEQFSEDGGESSAVYSSAESFPMYIPVMDMAGMLETPCPGPSFYVSNLGVESYGNVSCEESYFYVFPVEGAEPFSEDREGSTPIYSSADDFPMYVHVVNTEAPLETPDEGPLPDANNFGGESHGDASLEDSEEDKWRRSLTAQETQKGGSVQRGQREQLSKKIVQCTDCGKVFKHRYHLLQHQRTHGEARPYTCSQCGSSFSALDYLNTHLLVHTKKRKYKCTYCESSFVERQSLMTHISLHTGEKPFNCADCGRSFSEFKNLKIHHRIHTGEKPYQCDDCDSSFNEMRDLKRHQRIHTGEKPYKCTHCHKSFNQRSVLNAHILVHTGEKPFKCKDCGGTFRRLSYLRKHFRTDPGTEPYTCTDCSQSFKRFTCLKVHRRIHTREYPYRCIVCGCRFGQLESLEAHVCVPPGNKPFKCTDCGSSFNHLNNLKIHRRIHI